MNSCKSDLHQTLPSASDRLEVIIGLLIAQAPQIGTHPIKGSREGMEKNMKAAEFSLGFGA